MWMLILSFTFFTIIKVRAHAAFVSYSLYRSNLTSIASYLLMNLSGLISSPLSNVIAHQSLERLCRIVPNFFFEDFYKIGIEFVVQSTRTIASSTRKSLSIDFCSITSEAYYSFFISNLLFFFFWSKNLAIYFFRNSFSHYLIAFVFCLYRAITASLFNFLLDLWPHILSIHYCIKLLFVSIDHLGVAAKVLEVNQVVNIGRSFSSKVSLLSTNSNIKSLRLNHFFAFFMNIFKFMTYTSTFNFLVVEFTWHINRWRSHGEIRFYLLSRPFNRSFNKEPKSRHGRVGFI